jgi:8-oxo-dGTP pyrophosphatase MutT (NUDIX family)
MIKHLNANSYKKVVHAAMFFGNKILLSKRLKEGYHKNFYGDPGGKMEKGELPLDALIREIKEETGLKIMPIELDFLDCFIYPEREIKSFIFKGEFFIDGFKAVKNPEPDKQDNWQLFSIKEALKLKLLPSVFYYLNSSFK